MRLTLEQATTLLATDPFIILYVAVVEYIDEEGDVYVEVHGVSVAATNIDSDFCLEDLVKNLKRGPVGDVIANRPVGVSRYLCHMKFEVPGVSGSYSPDGYLTVLEPDPFWEIVSYELISTTQIEED